MNLFYLELVPLSNQEEKLSWKTIAKFLATCGLLDHSFQGGLLLPSK